MRAEAEWVASMSPDIPLHVTRFFPRYQMNGVEPTPVRTVRRLAEVASESLKFVYAGNV
jgi:pyruvate formate lyase activating enzyme